MIEMRVLAMLQESLAASKRTLHHKLHAVSRAFGSLDCHRLDMQMLGQGLKTSNDRPLAVVLASVSYTVVH